VIINLSPVMRATEIGCWRRW